MNHLAAVDPNDRKTFMVNRYPQGFGKVTIPEGEHGAWQVQQFEVPDNFSTEMYNLRAIRDLGPHRVVPPGQYTRLLDTQLMKGEQTVMSDTPAEAWEHYPPYRMAQGHVLLNGLGLGVLLKAILSKPSIERVTVVEISEDVIALVSPSYRDRRLAIIHDDALTWRPQRGTRFDVVWHDIWTDICKDNLPDMRRLHRQHGRRCDWQGSWSREYLRR